MNLGTPANEVSCQQTECIIITKCREMEFHHMGQRHGNIHMGKCPLAVAQSG